jgi:hypothetical protein
LVSPPFPEFQIVTIQRFKPRDDISHILINAI